MAYNLQKDSFIKKRGKAYWEKILQAWKASGLSPTVYCSSKGLGMSAFYKWKALLGYPSTKFRRAKESSTSIRSNSSRNRAPAFVELNLNTAVPNVLPSHLDIVLKNGLQLRLSCPKHDLGFSQLIKTLEALPC